MKKFITIFALGILFAQPVLAAVPDGTYFFMDNKGYDESGKQTFFCFDDGSCYTVEGVLSFTREITNKIDQLNQKITDLQNTVNQLQQPVVSQPQALITPTPLPATPESNHASSMPAPMLMGFVAINKYPNTNSNNVVNFGADVLIGTTSDEYPAGCGSYGYGPSFLSLKFDQPSKLKIDFLEKDSDFPTITHGTDQDYELLQTLAQTKPLITKQTDNYKKLWMFCHTDLGLKPNTTYYFKIQATNESGNALNFTTSANGKYWDWYYSYSVRY